MNIYLSVTLVGEYCLKRRLFLKRGYSEAIVFFFVFKIFINIDSGEGGRGASEVSSSINCPNTCDQDCGTVKYRPTNPDLVVDLSEFTAH